MKIKQMVLAAVLWGATTVSFGIPEDYAIDVLPAGSSAHPPLQAPPLPDILSGRALVHAVSMGEDLITISPTELAQAYPGERPRQAADVNPEGIYKVIRKENKKDSRLKYLKKNYPARVVLLSIPTKYFGSLSEVLNLSGLAEKNINIITGLNSKGIEQIDLAALKATTAKQQ
ncbi:MAG: hypothetical protein K0S08_1519 [Gammaproteobacteria bacterium]|jgi:hypothetical protein|nr:hypothetical protein [Gammaproteobacteria bacterium]